METEEVVADREDWTLEGMPCPSTTTRLSPAVPAWAGEGARLFRSEKQDQESVELNLVIDGVDSDETKYLYGR